MGNRKLLAAFLEKDNLKILAYESSGFKPKMNRIFAGQISFAPDVVRDGFIADGAKFTAQVKIALSQKETLAGISEVVLFLSPDKTFVKTLLSQDSPDGFIRTLPYFKEELLLTSEVNKTKVDSRTTYVAFEKKLVEDFQKPFLEVGKKVTGVKSATSVLVSKFSQIGKYFLLIPLEKEIVIGVCENGEVLEQAAFKQDVFGTQFGDFIGSHNLTDIKKAFTVGVFPPVALERVRSMGWEVYALETSDVYDLIVSSSVKASKFSLPAMPMPKVSAKTLSLIGAALVGVALVIIVVRSLPGLIRKPVVSPKPPTETAPEPAPVPQPQPADYTLRVLNGTLVTGEAARAADKLKGLGFDIAETKNATSAGFLATRIRPSKSVPDKIIAILKTSLLETYESTVIEPIPDSSVSGKLLIEIIIGQKKS